MIEPWSAPEPPAAGGKPAPEPARPASGLQRVTLRQIPGVQGALISIDPSTGRVLALVGGLSFEQSQFNRATQANRQPGSNFKPMVYLTALEEGISPNQMISNSESSRSATWRAAELRDTFGPPLR